MKLLSVSDAVEEAVIKSRRLREGIIRGYWNEIVGKLSSQSKPLGIKNGELLVVVTDSIYLHYLLLKKDLYIKKVNEILKEHYVDDIRFKISKVEKYNFTTEKIEKKERNSFISMIKELSLDEKIEYLKNQAIKREKEMEKKGFKKCKRCGSMFLGENDLCMPCLIRKAKRLEENNDTK